MAVTKFKSFKRLVLIKAAIVKQLSSFFRRQDVISERPQRIGSGPELRLHRRLPDHLDRPPDVRTNFQMINETLQEQPREFFPRKSRRLTRVSSSSAWKFLLFSRSQIRTRDSWVQSANAATVLPEISSFIVVQPGRFNKNSLISFPAPGCEPATLKFSLTFWTKYTSLRWFHFHLVASVVLYLLQRLAPNYQPLISVGPFGSW